MALVQQTTDNGNEVIKAFGSCYKQLIASDYLKALITTFFTAFFSTIILTLTPLFNGTELPAWVQIKVILISGLSSGFGALGRKFFTNSVGQPFKKDPPKVDNSEVATIKE